MEENFEAIDIIHSDEGEFIIDKDIPFPEDTRSSLSVHHERIITIFALGS